MTTKEKILAAALRLFNESNTQAATTNHIAAEAGISPGNLHYHYKNREAIVFALYETLRAKTKLAIDELPTTLAQLHRMHHAQAPIFWEYRFFHRELLFLLSRDPELKARYVADNIAHRGRIKTVITSLAANGYIDAPYDNIVEQLADTILMGIQFWNAYLETLDRSLSRENQESRILFFEGAMRPYLTPKGLKELSEIGA